MPELKFEKCGEDPRTREPLYRLIIGGRTVREDLTLDQVVEAINRRDEERLGWEHAPRTEEDDRSLRSADEVRTASHASRASRCLGRDDRIGGGQDGDDHV